MGIVITGASGFLGEAIVRKLRESSIACIGVTRKKTSSLHWVESYVDTPVGEVLIHLAENNDRTRANNEGMLCEREAERTIRALLSKGYQRVIYASSSVLYGDGSSEPRVETDPIYVNDTYTRIKIASEQAVLSSSRGCVMRLSNLYGSGMATGNVLSHILHQLSKRGPLLLQDITPVRDFLWIDDAADAICKMVSNFKSEVFNLGTGVGSSILDLAKTTLEVAGQREREIISLKPIEKLQESSIILNADKAKIHLDWCPKMSLQEGLNQIVNDYQKWSSNE